MSAPEKSLVLSRFAILNLKSIFAYSEIQWGTAAADAYQKRIEQAFQTILVHPELGASSDEIREGTRLLSVQRHLILYRFTTDRVVIPRVIHERMHARSAKED